MKFLPVYDTRIIVDTLFCGPHTFSILNLVKSLIKKKRKTLKNILIKERCYIIYLFHFPTWHDIGQERIGNSQVTKMIK